MPSFQDLEMSYRRGYHDGAWELFQSIRHLLSMTERERTLAWIQQDIRHWRVDDHASKPASGSCVLVHGLPENG
jgi:hypothetical protein